MATKRSDSRSELYLGISKSDPDQEMVGLIDYLKTLGKTSKGLAFNAIRAFYLPVSLSETSKKEKLAQVYASSVERVLKQILEILLLAQKDGIQIPEHILTFGINTLKSQQIAQGLAVQNGAIQPKELPIAPAILTTTTALPQISTNPTTLVEEDDTFDNDGETPFDADPFSHIALPSDFDPTVPDLNVKF
jgi:hypothetical protein